MTASAASTPPTPRKPDQPTLWIVAGPNGSGKSSAYNRSDIEGWGGSVWIVNPDLLTATILEREGCGLEEANLAAVQRIEEWLYRSLDVYQTVGVETVLSSSKYRKLVIAARQKRFLVKMIYVLLDSAELQIERVRRRVAKGGHDVPTDRLIARRERSFREFGWFVQQVDACYIYNNSSGEPRLIGGLAGGALAQFDDWPKDFSRALQEEGVSLIDTRSA